MARSDINEIKIILFYYPENPLSHWLTSYYSEMSENQQLSRELATALAGRNSWKWEHRTAPQQAPSHQTNQLIKIIKYFLFTSDFVVCTRPTYTKPTSCNYQNICFFLEAEGKNLNIAKLRYVTKHSKFIIPHIIISRQLRLSTGNIL